MTSFASPSTSPRSDSARVHLTALSLAIFATFALVSAPGCAPHESGDGEDLTIATQALQHPVRIAQSSLAAWTETLASDAFEGRDEGTEGGRRAREYIKAELAACNVTDVVEQPITTGQGTNVVARIGGTDASTSGRFVLVGAHYDHLGLCGGDICNGANDNAAGVAAALGVACALRQAPGHRSTLIAFWDAEEPPTFLTETMGSQFYASHPLVPLAQTDAAIILDLVGSQLWPGYSGHFAMGSEKSREVAQAVAAVPAPPGLILIQAGIHLVEETAYGHQPWSDYDAFRNQGVPFLFLSDGQNKDYHDVTDEASRLDFPKLTLEANWLLDVTWTLTNAANTPVFDAAGADDLRDANAIIAVLEAALAPGGMLDSLGLSRTAKRRLSSDLRDAKSVRSRLLRGGTASAADIAALRRGTQRVMCYAGPQYPEAVCSSAF